MTSTRIFVRPSEAGRQLVVYQLDLRAADDLAMILPLPVDPARGESALRFVSLEGYPKFFSDLNSGWEEHDRPIPGALSLSAGPTLRVHEVGEFEASFAPSAGDLERLDPRFRLPSAVWREAPVEGYGFAVFKLRELSSTTTRTPHPMAFEFARRDPAVLTFPTLHVHDGRWHARARFDHALFVQTDDPRLEEEVRYDFREEEGPVEARVDLARAAGTVLPGVPVYREVLFGELPNEDVTLRVG